MEFLRPGTVQDFQNFLARSGPKFLKFCSSGSGFGRQGPDSILFGKKVSICSATVKISKIPSRSNFSSDPDLDFDNIEIKWDLYGTRTRRLAVRHFATHAFCFRSTLPEKNLRSITSYPDRKSNIYLWLGTVKQD